MCIAIYKPEDKVISRETLETCWNNNDDGAGYMYVHNGSLRIKKGFMTFQDFYSAWCNHSHKQAVLHFRIKTHGDTNKENTHPFMIIPDQLGFVHNGIISNVNCDLDKNMSDTWHFNEKILKKLAGYDKDFFYDDDILDLIQGYVGYSKLIFMDKDNRVSIVNESKGDWDKGIWYSNSSYKTFKTYQSSNPKGNVTVYRGNQTRKKQDVNDEKIVLDSLVRLSYDFGDIKKGTTGIVEAFLYGNMVQVFLWGTTQASIKIPLWYLELDETTSFIDYSTLHQ